VTDDTNYFTGTSIEELELSVRAHRTLVNDYLDTIEKVKAKSDVELLNIPDLGRTTLREIRAAIEAREKRREVIYPIPPVLPHPYDAAKLQTLLKIDDHLQQILAIYQYFYHKSNAGVKQ
jgi:hypothetical protein